MPGELLRQQKGTNKKAGVKPAFALVLGCR